MLAKLKQIKLLILSSALSRPQFHHILLSILDFPLCPKFITQLYTYCTLALGVLCSESSSNLSSPKSPPWECTSISDSARTDSGMSTSLLTSTAPSMIHQLPKFVLKVTPRIRVPSVQTFKWSITSCGSSLIDTLGSWFGLNAKPYAKDSMNS